MRIPLALTAVAIACVVPPAPGQQGAEASSRAAVVGYASNIEAFPYYRCRFKTVYGVATSEADAKAARGKVNETVEALFVKDGGRELLEVFGATEATKPSTADIKGAKGGVVHVHQKGTMNQKYLRNGKSSGAFTAGLNTMLLGQADDGTPGPAGSAVYSPLHTWYGDRGPRSPDTQLSQSHRYPVRFLGELPAAHRVGIGFDEGAGNANESWLDPDRGYLPVEYRETMNGKPSGYGMVVEAKEFRPGRWFPMRRVGWSPDGGGRWSYCGVTVIELDLENRPTKNDFSTILPANTMVHRSGDLAFYKLKQEERLSPDDLDELFEKLEKSKTNPRMDTGIEHTGARNGWWVWAGAGVGTALLLLGAFLWWRKRRLARRASP